MLSGKINNRGNGESCSGMNVGVTARGGPGVHGRSVAVIEDPAAAGTTIRVAAAGVVHTAALRFGLRRPCAVKAREASARLRITKVGGADPQRVGPDRDPVQEIG